MFLIDLGIFWGFKVDAGRVGGVFEGVFGIEVGMVGIFFIKVFRSDFDIFVFWEMFG